MSRRLAIPRPSDFGTVGGWWTAGDRTATLASGAYSALPDRSGNGRDLSQGTAGQRPTKVAGVVNGRPVVRFASASSQFLASGTFAAIAQPVTWWVVAKWATQTGGPFDGPAGNRNLLYANTATSIAMNAGAQFAYTFDATAAFASFVCIFNGASSSLRINGAQVAAADVGSQTLTQVLSGQVSGVGFYNGDIADFGFFTALPSVTDFEKYYLRRSFATW